MWKERRVARHGLFGERLTLAHHPTLQVFFDSPGAVTTDMNMSSSAVKLCGPTDQTNCHYLSTKPTGFMPDRSFEAELFNIVDLCAAVLVSDEIYSGIPLGSTAG